MFRPARLQKGYASRIRARPSPVPDVVRHHEAKISIGARDQIEGARAHASPLSNLPWQTGVAVTKAKLAVAYAVYWLAVLVSFGLIGRYLARPHDAADFPLIIGWICAPGAFFAVFSAVFTQKRSFLRQS
jgi:hypothetical protein